MRIFLKHVKFCLIFSNLTVLCTWWQLSHALLKVSTHGFLNHKLWVALCHTTYFARIFITYFLRNGRSNITYYCLYIWLYFGKVSVTLLFVGLKTISHYSEAMFVSHLLLDENNLVLLSTSGWKERNLNFVIQKTVWQ